MPLYLPFQASQSGFRKGGGLEEGNLKGIIPLGFPSSSGLTGVIGQERGMFFNEAQGGSEVAGQELVAL